MERWQHKTENPYHSIQYCLKGGSFTWQTRDSAWTAATDSGDMIVPVERLWIELSECCSVEAGPSIKLNVHLLEKPALHPYCLSYWHSHICSHTTMELLYSINIGHREEPCHTPFTGSMERWMDGWMKEFNITFAEVRPNWQAEITVMRWMALVTRMKLPPIMAAPGI